MLYQKYIYASDNALILCLLLLFGFFLQKYTLLFIPHRVE